MDRPLATKRLLLPPLAADAIQALIDGEADRIEALTGVRFPRPLIPPPLMADALPFFRERLVTDPAIAPWWIRLIVDRATLAAVGSAGFTGRPDATGAVTIGYAIYPAFQGQDYATEAVRGLVGWAFADPAVTTVRATVPPWNAPSLRVVAKAGFRRTGTAVDDDEGVVEVWETHRPDAVGPDSAARSEATNAAGCTARSKHGGALADPATFSCPPRSGSTTCGSHHDPIARYPQSSRIHPRAIPGGHQVRRQATTRRE